MFTGIEVDVVPLFLIQLIWTPEERLSSPLGAPIFARNEVVSVKSVTTIL